MFEVVLFKGRGEVRSSRRVFFGDALPREVNISYSTQSI